MNISIEILDLSGVHWDALGLGEALYILVTLQLPFPNRNLIFFFFF